VLCFVQQGAEAQTAVVRPERLPEPGRPVATSYDSTALVKNPANLAYLPGPEFRWTGIYLQEKLSVPWQGHAFGFAGRLPFVNIGTGLRLDLVSPPPGGTGRFSADNYQWLTWGLALPAGRNASLGFSVQGAFSDGIFADDLTSFSFGMTERPHDVIALSIVAHDINAPRNAVSMLGRSYDSGVAIRPTGNDDFELSLENKYLASEDVWIPKAVVGLDLPHIGRLRGDVQVSDPTRDSRRAWVASAGLNLNVNAADGSVEVGGGAITGNGLGADDSYNPYSSVAIKDFRERSAVESGRYAIRIRLESTPDTRQHVMFLRQLWSIAKEKQVDAVVFELRTEPAASLAHVQELRDAVFELRRAGKRTLCHLEDASGAALYFCAATNKVLVNPAGGLRFSGLRSRHLYFARLLDKLGIRADFIRIGAHKSAPEQFTESGATEVARSDKIELLQQYERHFSEGLAVGRGMTVEQVRERIGKGPFVAEEAKQYAFVDGFAFDDEIERAVRDLTGRPTPLINDVRVRYAPEAFGNQGYVAVVYVDGDMIDGRNRTIPFLGMSVTGSYTIAETLKAVRENRQIKAVVLRVESPGGSSMASDVIWRQVELTAKAKPVVVSMGAAAASGGYYIAAPATRIFANPLSITGSIGVFYGKADIAQLLSKIGVDVEVYKTHPRADAESMFRPFSADERKELERKVQQFYDMFLERVAQGRKLTKEQVDKQGQGKVWTGEQAKQHGLVDELGGLRQALEFARKQANLPADAPLIELPVVQRSFLGELLGLPGLKQSLLDAPMPDTLTKTLRALGPFVIHKSDRPLARLDFTLEDLQ
jgi:protease-4